MCSSDLRILCFRTSIMALVGPNVPLVNVSSLLYTLRQFLDVPGRGGCVLASKPALGDRTAISPVPNGHCVRFFISATSLMDVDSPKGRSLPCAASTLSSRPLAILHVQRLLPVDFFLLVSIALLLSVLSDASTELVSSLRVFCSSTVCPV